jgi:branched-chain amino acid transport system permease protein
LSANALLMAYIGGTTVFGGPILGAILITVLQSGVSLLSNSWLVYVGVMSIAMVIFAPARLAGLIKSHGQRDLPRTGAGRPAIVWASAQIHSMLLVTRGAKGFPAGDPGVRIPYRI